MTSRPHEVTGQWMQSRPSTLRPGGRRRQRKIGRMGDWVPAPITYADCSPSGPIRYAHGAEASHFVVHLVGKDRCIQRMPSQRIRDAPWREVERRLHIG